MIGCSETWLNDKSYIDILNLDGYKLFNKNRLSRTGSGLCLHLNSAHTINIGEDFIIDGGCDDPVFLEIIINNGKGFVVGVVYCSP